MHIHLRQMAAAHIQIVGVTHVIWIHTVLLFHFPQYHVSYFLQCVAMSVDVYLFLGLFTFCSHSVAHVQL